MSGSAIRGSVVVPKSVGDLAVSLIPTTEVSDAEPCERLVACQRRSDGVERDPAAWMP